MISNRRRSVTVQPSVHRSSTQAEVLQADAPTRCASSGTCAPLVLGDNPCMLALERWTKYHSIQCTFESGGWGGGQWLWCTAPPRLAGCDHTFIAVPQAAHPCSIPGLCMRMVVCGLIRVTYFEPGLYSQVVLSFKILPMFCQAQRSVEWLDNCVPGRYSLLGVTYAIYHC